MLAPKKGLLCNLNHIHLQHISLGLHLSRHPELQETSGSTAGGDQTGCSHCPENREQVDANSNNPSLKCRCCESHTPQTVTLGLQNQAAPEDFPCLQTGEEVASPCDPPCDLTTSSSSSSVSSCSDFSSDDSPVSVYCKGFSGEEAQSPESRARTGPSEDAREGPSLAAQGGTSDERDANFNPAELQRADTRAGGSPDSLCSGSLLDSQCEETSPSVAAQESTSICSELDPNCNPLPDANGALPAPPAPGQWGPGLSRAPEPRSRVGSTPPPVPPRPRRRLQVLSGHRAELPLLPVRPAEPEPGSGDRRDAGKKTITSFHELAQKRKRNAAGPALAQARADRSDWLIVFSPDTELPPHSELLCGAPGPEPAQLQPDWLARAASCRQREVTTFKELRYRSACSKPKGQPAAERAEPAAPQRPPAPRERAAGGQGQGAGAGWLPPVPAAGQGLAPAGTQQLKRRRCRPGLQPIAEGQRADAELPPPRGLPGEQGPGSGCREETRAAGLQGAGAEPRLPGTAGGRDEADKESKSPGPFPGRRGAARGGVSPARGRAAGPGGPRGRGGTHRGPGSAGGCGPAPGAARAAPRRPLPAPGPSSSPSPSPRARPGPPRSAPPFAPAPWASAARPGPGPALPAVSGAGAAERGRGGSRGGPARAPPDAAAPPLRSRALALRRGSRPGRRPAWRGEHAGSPRAAEER